MIFEQWDIVLASFPFIDRARSKPRPVAVLSRGGFNASHDLAIVCMITTAAAGLWSSDHPIADLSPTGLRHACVVRWKIASLSTYLLDRRIGHFAPVDRQDLERRLADIMPTDNRTA